jgi:hypothetical protein
MFHAGPPMIVRSTYYYNTFKELAKLRRPKSPAAINILSAGQVGASSDEQRASFVMRYRVFFATTSHAFGSIQSITWRIL